MTTPSEVTRLLVQTPFRKPEAAKAQIFAVLNKFEHLFADRRPFTYPDGVSKEMIVLTGTIPVSYKSGKYNIPITVFLPPDFPSNFPVCFVSPTPDMVIRESGCVDASGRVFLPYLSGWKFGHSKLVKVIEQMRKTFGDSCPIFMKPAVQEPQVNHSVQQADEQGSSAPPSLECLICMTGAKVMMCVPCHHVVYCAECRDSVLRQGLRDCPVCRSPVTDYVRVYL